MPNRLADSNSPYLLQHKDNPVDWHPWGAEALELAQKEQRPIFLSVGYAACHWCHVMEHESFEDPRIANLLNERFVCIKVDREERPDVDQIYMHAVQAMTGQGGWPMSVFLTPDGRPFFGGTYYPPSSQMGMPGFDQIVNGVAEAWSTKHEEVVGQADQLTKHLQEVMREEETLSDSLNRKWIADACEKKAATYDPQNGGFGGRPKFPHPMDLELFLRQWHDSGESRWLNMVSVTLSKMADGGIYDHLGGGFARYSVDERWLVPHFEKMLYDNALLATSYLRAFQATGSERFANVACETLEYLMRDMIDESGAVQCTEDADSEGVEGKYYVWTPDEVTSVLGQERGERFCKIFDVSPEGNFEGKSVLNLRRPLEVVAREYGGDFAQLAEELSEDRAKLLSARELRVRPGRDDKVLVSWNALAIEAFAVGSRVLKNSRMLETATKAAEFIWSEMRDEGGRLLHVYRRGTSHQNAFVDDYASLINSFVTLFETTGHSVWIDRAGELAEEMIQLFSDSQRGGFFFTPNDHEALILRTKDYHDTSVPSGNGEAALALLRLAALIGNEEVRDAGITTLQSAVGVMTEQSMAASRLLTALHLATQPMQQIVIVCDDQHQREQFLNAHFAGYRPSRVIAAVVSGESISERLKLLVSDKLSSSERPAMFVCKGSQCQAPVVGTAEILEALSAR